MKRFVLMCALVSLAACAKRPDYRVTAEHRQLHNRAAIVALQDPDVRLQFVAQQPTRSTQARAVVEGLDANEEIRALLATRLKGKGLAVVPIAYEPTAFARAYGSSMAFAAPGQVRDELCALAAGQNVDMLVVVYRQAAKDIVEGSVENLVGHGLVRHETTGLVHAYANISLEALTTRACALVGNSDASRSQPVDDLLWQEAFNEDRGRLSLDGEAAVALRKPVTQVLRDAVMSAAQEAGLSN